jgi:hypothetical protein
MYLNISMRSVGKNWYENENEMKNKEMCKCSTDWNFLFAMLHLLFIVLQLYMIFGHPYAKIRSLCVQLELNICLIFAKEHFFIKQVRCFMERTSCFSLFVYKYFFVFWKKIKLFWLLLQLFVLWSVFKSSQFEMFLLIFLLLLFVCLFVNKLILLSVCLDDFVWFVFIIWYMIVIEFIQLSILQLRSFQSWILSEILIGFVFINKNSFIAKKSLWSILILKF